MRGKVLKIALSLTTSFSLLGANFATTLAATQATTGLDTEYDMLELERTKPGDNLITNGDFEKGNTGWLFKKSQVTDWTGAAYDGKYCGLLPVQQNDSVLYQALSLKPNTDYVAKAKIAIGKVGGQANFNLKTNSLATTVNEGVTVSCTSEDQEFVYQDVEFEFNTGNITNVELCVMKWTEATSGPVYESQVYVDNVSLSEVVSGDIDSDDEVYDVIWKDEFDGQTGDVDSNGLDTDDWGYELGCVRGVEQQHYTKDKENVHVTDGKLVLEVTDREKEYQYQNPRGDRQVIYNSGSVRTHGKQEFLYGRIEILAKLPEGQATFPAFWTLGSDFTLDGSINGEQGDGWPVSGEIDIMESIGNPNVVYQTLHYAQNVGDDNGKYAGNGKMTSITTEGVQIDGETYHVFGINWSENKMEWYIDDQIVRTVDYSDDPTAQAALNRPQYIQLNFATGGNWPGDAGTNLAGQQFKIEYVYYAQNQEQKEAAAKYYADTVSVEADDVTIYQGDIPDLLENVTLKAGSANVDSSQYTIDYSIDNEHMFTTNPVLTDGSISNDTNQTKVECLVNSVENKDKIANLAPGEYNIHYSAMHDTKPSVRKTVKLTVKERTFPSDYDLNGIIGEKLSTIVLPEGWSWVNPDAIITNETGEYEVQFVNGTYSQKATVTVHAVKEADKTMLEDKLDIAVLELDKVDTYTKASRKALETAIASARAVFADVNATDEEVAAAVSSLNDAIAQLETYVDDKEIDDLMAESETILENKDKYTQESLDQLSNVLSDLKVAVESGDKELIQSAYAKVDQAIQNLKELTEKPSEETPENTPNQSQDQQNNQITGTEKPVGNNNANNDSQTSSTTVVKTNDQTALLPIVCMLGVSIIGIVLLKRRNNY